MGVYDCAGLTAAILILVLFRLHAFDLPLETDECNYAVIAARLLAGDRLYVDVWDHQPFGVFTLFAAVIAVFGDAPHVFRCMAMLFSAASLLLIFAILRRVVGRSDALLGILLFALASSDPGTGGEGCNREIYMNTLILAAWYCAIRSSSRPNQWLFTSGAALAIASGLKTIVAVHWVFLAGWIVVDGWPRSIAAGRGSRVAKSLFWFALGPMILWVCATAYFAATGRLDEFIDAAFLFNLGYSDGSEPFLVRFVRFFHPIEHRFIFGSALPLWIGAGVSLICLAVEGVVRRKLDSLAAVSLLFAGYVATCLPGRFWPHYYYLAVPGLVIGVAVLVDRLSTWFSEYRSFGAFRSRILRVIIYIVSPIALGVTEVRDYLLQSPFGITVKRYNSRDFWGQAQGQNVASVTGPDDMVFVFGNDASIYYYSHRPCASRYTMITGLGAPMRGAEERRLILLSELERTRPRLIVVLFDEPPWPEWRLFLEKYYGEPAGWDFGDRTRKPIMFVVARKDRPIRPIDWNWDRSTVGGW